MLPLMCESVFLAGTSASLCRDSNPSFAPGDCLRRQRLEIRGAGRSPVVGAAPADMIAVIGIYSATPGGGDLQIQNNTPETVRRQATGRIEASERGPALARCESRPVNETNRCATKSK